MSRDATSSNQRRRAAQIALCAAIFLCLVEGAARLARGGARVMAPVLVNERGVAALPADWTGDVAYPGGERVSFVTGSCGERLASQAARAASGQALLVLGDSQAFGWGRSFEDTFGARIARARFADASRARLLAAPRMDPERNRAALACYLRHHDAPTAVVLTVNLGNDLEELFVGRGAPSYLLASSPIQRWLAVHSFAFLDWIVLRRRLFPGSIEGPLSASVADLLSADELSVMALALVDGLAQTRGSLPPGTALAVAVIPADFELDARELDKYRPLYAADVFRMQRRRRELNRAALRGFRGEFVQLLTSRGFAVADLGSSALEARRLYERSSHHLTKEGHVALADLVGQALR